MRCPICNCVTVTYRLGADLYRVECVSNYCEWDDEFTYVAPVNQRSRLTPRRVSARVATLR